MKNLAIIEVVSETSHLSAPELIAAATKVHTAGDSVAVAPPFTDAQIATATGTLQTAYNGTQTKPPTVLQGAVTKAFNILAAMYKANAGYLKTVSNAAAVTAGDVSAGTIVVIRCGYVVKSEKASINKHFKGDSTIEGEIDISTKSVGTGAVYIRQYGVTPTKHVPPVTIAEPLVSKETSISLINLKSGLIYGFREASILPIPKKKKTGSVILSATAKTATPTASTKGHKVVFTDGATSHYVWSGWIYVTVK